MRAFSLVAAGVGISLFAASWPARRALGERIGIVLSLLGQLVIRAVAIAVLFLGAAKLAEHGGWLIAAGALLGLIGLAMTAISGVLAVALWQILTDGLPDEG